jgi:hypothetical protein
MDEKQRQLEREKSERQLEQSAARLRMLDDRTEKRSAEGSAAEVLGLHAMQDRLRDQIKALKDADEASFNDLVSLLERSNQSFSRGIDAAGERLDRLDDANDRWLEADADQVFAACGIFSAWLGEEWVEDKKVAAESEGDLRAAWDDAKKKRQALQQAAPQKKEAARRSLQESLTRVRQKLEGIAARLRGKAQPREQRT